MEAMDKSRKNPYIIKQIFNYNKLTRPLHESRENIVKIMHTMKNIRKPIPQFTKILDISATQAENIMIVVPAYEQSNWWTLKAH